MSLFANNMIIYVDDLKELLELISNYCKASGYKVNVQKPITFLLLISNEQVKLKIKSSISMY